MVILVVDAQGGGLGRALIEKLVAEGIGGSDGVSGNAEIWAVGTNSQATAAMRKAGANACATGENAVVFNAQKADLIAGGIGIIAANSMMGEITPAMAAAISQSDAVKLLIPYGKCNFKIIGALDVPLAAKLDEAVAQIKKLVQEKA